jgi:hypothetical protein
MTNADSINLAQLGLAEDMIIAKIHAVSDGKVVKNRRMNPPGSP